MTGAVGLKRASLAALVISLAACSEEQSIKSHAEAAVRAHLKDPPSARFGEAFIVRHPPNKEGVEMVAVCGMVDGKNSFGGYTGGSRYVVDVYPGAGSVLVGTATIEDSDRQPTASGTGETIFESVFWNAYCVDAAHPATRTAEAAY